jgi:hypothetical protein
MVMQRSRHFTSRTRLFVLSTIAVVFVVVFAGLAGASPVVSVPPEGGGAILPPNLNAFDLAQVGYEQSEYFLEGTATAYTPTAPLTTDGKWSVAPTTPPADPAAYKTRAVVYRPVDPKKFNGTVVVEWLNVSGQIDANPDWTQTHTELIRDGFAWVGVSAQAAGVNALKCQTSCMTPGDPARYETLSHPGDSYSYDIFSQAGQAIRDSAQILGGLTPKTLLAAGESQSAGRMVTYIDAVQPLAHVYDGFLVHSRGPGGAPLSQSPLADVSPPSPTFIRTDLDMPVFVFQTELDVSSAFTARQPDTNRFRQWEAAGTSHFDTYGLLIGPSDTGDGQGAVANLEAMQHPTSVPSPGGLCAKPINTGGAHWLLNSAIYWLNQWVTNGTAPPIGQSLQIASTSPFAYAKDANGNTIGGVRTPQVDAPIATLTGGDNSGANDNFISMFCFLFGSTVPSSPQQLATLYKNHGQFVKSWTQDITKLVKEGFLLEADGNELQQSAVHSQIGK